MSKLLITKTTVQTVRLLWIEHNALKKHEDALVSEGTNKGPHKMFADAQDNSEPFALKA